MPFTRSFFSVYKIELDNFLLVNLKSPNLISDCLFVYEFDIHIPKYLIVGCLLIALVLMMKLCFLPVSYEKRVFC